jgi:uncharacterized protein (TIGR03067 family)
MKEAAWLPGLMGWICLMVPAEAQPTGGDDVQGIWKPVQAELGGARLPDALIAAWRLELRDGKYTLTGAESPDSGTYTFEESKKPKTMDVTGTDGPNKGKTFPCIYELDDDILRICYDLSGKERPKEFKTAKQTKLYLVTYKRAPR